MAILGLEPIRSRNAQPIVGFELLVKDAACMGLAPGLLELVQRHAVSAARCNCSTALELSVASAGAGVFFSLIFRLRLSDLYMDVRTLQDICGSTSAAAVSWLADNGCKAVCAAAHEGVLAVRPAEGVCVFRKQGHIGNYREEGRGVVSAPLRYYSSFRASRVNWHSLAAIVSGYKHSGFSLSIIPAVVGAEENKYISAALSREDVSPFYREAYSDIAASQELWSFTLSMWGDACEQLRAALEISGVELRAIEIAAGDKRIHVEMRHDPWALSERLSELRSIRAFGRLASFLTKEECEGLFGAGMQHTVPDAPLHTSPDRISIDMGAAAAHTDRIGELADRLAKMDGSLSKLASCVEQLASSTSLTGVISSIDRVACVLENVGVSDKTETFRLAADMEEKLLGMKDALIESVNRRLAAATEEMVSRVNAHTDAKITELTQALEHICRVAETSTPEQVIAEVKASPIAFGLSPEDYKRMEISGEHELRALGADDSLLDTIESSFALYNALEQTQSSNERNYVHFAVVVGYLYEQLAFKCMADTEQQYQAENGGTEFCSEDGPNLEVFDRITFSRVWWYRDRVRFVVNGSSCSMGFAEWAIWFNLLRRVRALRNRIHRGNLTKEEYYTLFKAMFFNEKEDKIKLIDTADGERSQPCVPVDTHRGSGRRQLNWLETNPYIVHIAKCVNPEPGDTRTQEKLDDDKFSASTSALKYEIRNRARCNFDTSIMRFMLKSKNAQVRQ